MSLWWIHKPFLIGGPNPTETQLMQVRGKGVNLAISLLDEKVQPLKCPVERLEAMGFIHHNIPVPDFTPPGISQILEFLGLVRKFPEGGKVFIHCQAGMGRTGTMAAAYWISQGLGPEEAVKCVRKSQPYAVETDEQMQVLVEFHRIYGDIFKSSQRSPESQNMDSID
ncbi:MAG: dual specificity protein phosphatase family protein [Candidatus Riflebacteria bacterium]|nr:dual specificity protein phosphatase family protein [Candidatus Riflebacteria bacterium]